MHRRQVLKSLGVAALAQLSSSELFAAGRALHARIQETDEDERYVFKSLDPEQNTLVTLVSELVVPETDTPGAKAARVNEFIDLMLTEWFTADERRRFLAGLAGLEQRSTEAHGRAFAACADREQIALLRELEAEALESAKDVGPTRSPVASSDSPADQPFFAVMKWLTLYGYYTSQIGMEQELEHVVFPGTYEGCAPLRRA